MHFQLPLSTAVEITAPEGTVGSPPTGRMVPLGAEALEAGLLTVTSFAKATRGVGSAGPRDCFLLIDDGV